MAKVFSDCPASQSQFLSDLPLAHPTVMEFVNPLMQLPLAQVDLDLSANGLLEVPTD